MEAITPILIYLFWFIVIALSWRNHVARHIGYIGAWSQICLTIAETYYPQFLQVAVYSILIIWAIVVTLMDWGISKIVAKDNNVILTLFYSCSILAFGYLLNIISVPRFYQIGVLMTAMTYMALAALMLINKTLFKNYFCISASTVGMAFLVGNTIHLMTEWTALVFFFENLLYVVAFLLFLLGILGYILVYYRKVSFLSYISAYAFGFVMGFYGYGIIAMMHRVV